MPGVRRVAGAMLWSDGAGRRDPGKAPFRWSLERAVSRVSVILTRTVPVALVVLTLSAGGDGPPRELRRSAEAGLLHADPSVRRAAVRVVAEGGRASAPLLVEALWDRDPSVRAEVRRALGRLGPGAVPALVDGLESDDLLRLRRRSAAELAALGPAARAAVPALSDALRDEDPVVRYWAATALGRLESRAVAALPALRRAAADDRRAVVRHAAVVALGSVAGRRAVPVLRRAAEQDASGAVRHAAIRALSSAEDGREVTGLLARALTGDRDEFVRIEAARALARRGSHRIARVALTDALRDESPRVRAAARQALPETATP